LDRETFREGRILGDIGDMQLKRLVPIALTALFITNLLFFTYPAYGQSHVEVTFDWEVGVEIPQGEASYISITVTNTQKKLVTLTFVGVRFDWLDENTYIYGGGSENNLTLKPGSSASYQISFNIPEKTSPGNHSVFILVVYNVEEEGGEIEYHQIIEVKPGVNVVAIVTVTETEVVVITVNEQEGLEGASRWPITLAAFFGLIALITVIIAYVRKKRSRR
jgi:hypothetical protein